MSIVKMNKVTIIGTKDKEEEILKEIMKKGFVQVEDSSYLADDDELGSVFNKVDKNEEIVSITKKKNEVEKAIDNINRINKLKKSMFPSKPDYVELTEDEANSLCLKAVEINNNEQEISKLLSTKEELNNTKTELLPWKSLEISADLTSVKYIKIFLGKLPNKYKLEQLQIALGKSVTNYSINKINQDKQYSYLVITTDSENIDIAKKIVRKYEFIEQDIIDTEKTVNEQIQEIDSQIAQIDEKINELTKTISPELLSKLENLFDYFEIQKELKKVQKNIVTTKNTFYLEGWIPAGAKIKNNSEYIIKYRHREENRDINVDIDIEE